MFTKEKLHDSAAPATGLAFFSAPAPDPAVTMADRNGNPAESYFVYFHEIQPIRSR
jgi:hypothetical protein